MAGFKVVISECYYENVDQETEILRIIDADLVRCSCKTEEDVIAAAKDCDALICQFAPITRRVIETLDRCKVIVRYAIGVDIIDLKAAEEKGIYVCNVPDYCIDEVSNHAIALLMDCARKLTLIAGNAKKGITGYQAVKPMLRMEGKTLGLVGFGRIPRCVAHKMQNFGLQIITYDPYLPDGTAEAVGVKKVSFEDLLRESDYISVHCPLTEETHHLFNKEAFEKMKDQAVFVNTSRGAVVDEEALEEALRTGQIGMAGLDVTEKEPITPEHPLLQLDNAVVTPHIAWYTEESVLALQRMVAEETARVLTGNPPKHPVNHPAV